MIFMILVIFVMMVLFMKIFPKRVYNENSLNGAEYGIIQNVTNIIENKSSHSIEL